MLTRAPGGCARPVLNLPRPCTYTINPPQFGVLGGQTLSWRAWGAFAALGIIWGLPYFFIKLAVQDLSPLVVAWSRVVLGTMILLPIAWRRGALRSLAKHKAAICAFAL